MRLLKSMEYLQLNHDSPEIYSREFDDWMTRFFRNFRNSDGSWKTTARSRHRALDDILLRVLDRRALRPKVVMDIGVASGATTVDLKKALEAHGFEATIIATDRTITCYVVRLHRELDALVEANGHILKIEVHGIDFSPWCGTRDYLTGSFLVKGVVRRYVEWCVERAGVRFPIEHAPSSGQRLRIDGPYRMITPELKGRPDVAIIEENILAPTPPELVAVADVVRLAHVVRPDRFSEAEIHQIVRNVRSRCRDGAVVMVCRSHPRARVRGSLEASVFVAVPGGFALEDRVGPGSEVEPYFLGMTSRQATAS
jgi:hypothetical protein